MFVDEKAAGEAQTAEQANLALKLSEAIRSGCRVTKEGRLLVAGPDDARMLNNCGTCALGAALVATGYDGRSPFHSDAYRWLGSRFSIPEEVMLEASARHYRREMTRLEIAEWLEERGY